MDHDWHRIDWQHEDLWRNSLSLPDMPGDALSLALDLTAEFPLALAAWNTAGQAAGLNGIADDNLAKLLAAANGDPTDAGTWRARCLAGYLHPECHAYMKRQGGHAIHHRGLFHDWMVAAASDPRQRVLMHAVMDCLASRRPRSLAWLAGMMPGYFSHVHDASVTLSVMRPAYVLAHMIDCHAMLQDWPHARWCRGLARWLDEARGGEPRRPHESLRRWLGAGLATGRAGDELYLLLQANLPTGELWGCGLSLRSPRDTVDWLRTLPEAVFRPEGGLGALLRNQRSQE